MSERLRCERCGAFMELAPGIDWFCVSPECVEEDRKKFKAELRSTASTSLESQIREKDAEIERLRETIHSIVLLVRQYQSR